MSATPDQPPRAALRSKILVIALVAIFLLGLAGFIVAVISTDEDEPASPRPPASSAPGQAAQPRIMLALAAAEGTEPFLAVPSPGIASIDEAPAPASPAASPADPAPTVATTAQATPVVPVVSFWSRKMGISRRDIIRALEEGKLRGFKRVIVAEGLKDALADALGMTIHEDVAEAEVARVERAAARGALGLLLATDVSARVRALKVNGASLFGNERIKSEADWPLLVTTEVAEGAAWEQDQTWVLVAAGDAFTDRGVYDSVVRKGRGVDYPFDGGTARVTGFGCCDPIFNANIVPRYRLTGNKGVVRRLFRDAELAIVNHEQPVTEDAVFHRSGIRFSGRPELTRMFTRGGIDWVSLGNNHIKDYGTKGIKDTRRILRKAGIGFGGAGKNLKQARRVSYLEVGDTTIAIIACVGVARAAWAAPQTSGATPCLDRYMVPDIKRAEKKADFVIVMPHWGVEYTRQPLPSSRKHAAKWVRAGADLILGGHSHVAGAIEDIDGSPVLYSLGNFIFDQPWSTNTMESALVEATFQGGKLAQLRLRPYIIHNGSQPNFLDPAKGEGRRLLKQIRNASADWLEW